MIRQNYSIQQILKIQVSVWKPIKYLPVSQSKGEKVTFTIKQKTLKCLEISKYIHKSVSKRNNIKT